MKFFPIRSFTPPSFLESKPFLEGNEDIVNLITLEALRLNLRRIHWQRSLANYTTYTMSYTGRTFSKLLHLKSLLRRKRGEKTADYRIFVSPLARLLAASGRDQDVRQHYLDLARQWRELAASD
jgi:hypothetical protein